MNDEKICPLMTRDASHPVLCTEACKLYGDFIDPLAHEMVKECALLFMAGDLADINRIGVTCHVE